ncbi:MAG: Periplasmic zinc-binding protein TroA [Chlamydiae bacterium]|nr:Periplasmic zinc-binding protein TroA [Chlamydiota bacterium]
MLRRLSQAPLLIAPAHFLTSSGFAVNVTMEYNYLVMRKSILLLVVFLAFLCGCECLDEQGKQWRQPNGKLKVLTTIAMIEDLAGQVGGEYVDALSLIRGELDPHSYELVKGDEEKFLQADLIFYNGLGLEHGASLRKQLDKNSKAIAVTAPILEADPPLILELDGQIDPHVWMDIALWMRTLDPIVEALVQADPAHASFYRERGKKVLQEMMEADQTVFQVMQKIPPEKRYMVTSHDAFHYFTRHYLSERGEEDWESRCAAPEGLAPEAEMSVRDVMEILAHIERFGVTVLFPESNVSKDGLRKILHASQAKGREVRLCHDPLYGDSMGEAVSYLEMIGHNADILSRELSR